jgi:hypothetical protein
MSPNPFSRQCFDGKAIDVERDLLFCATRAPLVKYFELLRFDGGTGKAPLKF